MDESNDLILFYTKGPDSMFHALYVPRWTRSASETSGVRHEESLTNAATSSTI